MSGAGIPALLRGLMNPGTIREAAAILGKRSHRASI